ncbi:MAG: cytidine/deoxycytidylate deaminase family protein [Patescibacteria group bacterium]|jgi:dCMP deaminase
MGEKESHKRPSWDEYFMEVARTVGTRGTCDRGRSGCVIVKDKRILTTGYVGSPVGIAHCDEIGHEMNTVYNEKGEKHQHCIRTSHAEQNALAQAARFGISINGGTVYCKMEPCYVCAKMLINAGIVRVVAEKKYHGAERSREIFKEAGVQLDVLIDEEENYSNKR